MKTSRNGAQATGAARAWSTWLVTLGLGAACFAGGRLSVETPEPAAPKCDGPKAIDLASALRRAQPADTPQPKVPQRAITTPPVHLTQAPDETAAEELRAYEEKQGRELVGLLRERVRRASFMASEPMNYEGVVNQIQTYLEGWVDGLVRTSPTLVDDLAHEIEVAMCDPQTPAVEVMMYARVGRMMPELTSSAGFECVLSTKIEEGPVLRETLGAYVRSGLPAPEALAGVVARAKDDRTLQVLSPERVPPVAPPPEPEAEEPELSAEEQRAVLDGLIAERSQGLTPLPQ